MGARRKFTPEFMNRIDKTVVFQSLGRPELDRILTLEAQQCTRAHFALHQRTQLCVSGHRRGQIAVASRRNRSELRGAAPEARDRTARGASALQSDCFAAVEGRGDEKSISTTRKDACRSRRRPRACRRKTLPVRSATHRPKARWQPRRFRVTWARWAPRVSRYGHLPRRLRESENQTAVEGAVPASKS